MTLPLVIVRPCVHNNQDQAVHHADGSPPRFVTKRVFERHRKQILKHKCRHLKIDVVIAYVLIGLGGVPSPVNFAIVNRHDQLLK